ncbi:MAG TPA: hypothetical protein VFC03_15280 [Acidimicrobiales bacterium]|nr:hypothetical protein [Acidimicrobiales bacterium]
MKDENVGPVPSLREHVEALMEVRVGMAGVVMGLEDSRSKERLWVCLDRLDSILDELAPSLDPEWRITEYVEYRWSPADVAYRPAEWDGPRATRGARGPTETDKSRLVTASTPTV